MPTVFRSMKRDTDGLPVVGSSNSRELGVRVPPNSTPDVDLDTNDNVVQNGKGMSVVENWRHLLAHFIPKRLKPQFPGAAGSNTLSCYKMGTGVFAVGPIGNDLKLALKPGSLHAGNVMPTQSVHHRQFQADLAATRSQWSIDET